MHVAKAPVLPKDASYDSIIVNEATDAKAEEKRRKRNVKISKINHLTVTCCNRNQSSRANEWASWRAGNAKRNGKYRFSSAIFQLYGHLFSFVLCVFCSLLILLVFKSRAKHLSSGCVLSNGIGLFAKMWSRFIYHSTIWTQCTFSVHTLGHMWTNFSFFIFKASHFLRLFLVLRFEDCCTIFSSWTDSITFIGSQRANKQLKRILLKRVWVCTTHTRQTTNKCLVTGASRTVLVYNWSLAILQFTLRIFVGESNKVETERMLFQLNWSIEWNKVTAIEQMINANKQSNGIVSFGNYPKQTMWNINAWWTWNKGK